MTWRFAMLAMIMLCVTATPLAAASKKGVGASQDPNEIVRLKGEKIRRENEAKSRRWDAEMKRMMGSVCRGC